MQLMRYGWRLFDEPVSLHPSGDGGLFQVGTVSGVSGYSRQQWLIDDDVYPFFSSTQAVKIIHEFDLSRTNKIASLKAIHKYVRPDIIPPFWVSVLLQRAISLVVDLYRSHTKTAQLWPHELIIDHLKRESSMGFPERLLYKSKGAALSDPNYLDHLLHVPEFYADHSWPRSLSTAAVKAGEILAMAKVLANNSRNFIIMPLATQYLGKRLFGAQHDVLESLSVSHPIKIGMTIYYRGFDRLMSYFLKNNIVPRPKGRSHDYKKFDACISSVLLYAVEKVRLGWFDYTSHEVDLVHAYYDEVIHTLFLGPSGELFYKNKGVPSGSPTTSVDDSIANLLMFVVAALDVHPELNAGNFLDYVRVAVFGDDIAYVEYCAPLEQSLVRVSTAFGSNIKAETLGYQGLHFLNCSPMLELYKDVLIYIPVPLTQKYAKSLTLHGFSSPIVFLEAIFSHMLLYAGSEDIFNELRLLFLHVLRSFDELLETSPEWVALRVARSWTRFDFLERYYFNLEPLRGGGLRPPDAEVLGVFT